MYFAASKITNIVCNILFSCQFCYQYITEVFLQPTSMILGWAWVFGQDGLKSQQRKPNPEQVGLNPIATPHFNHWQQFGKSSGSLTECQLY